MSANKSNEGKVVTPKQVPIAVVGVSALFPGSTESNGFWRDILAGRDMITNVPASHWLTEDYYDPDPRAPDKTYCNRGAFLTPVDFDPMEFGLPPSTLPATDTAQVLALIVAQRVLDDASQGQFASMDRERMSVILGVTSTQELVASLASRLQKPVWIKALRESGIEEKEAQAICDRIGDNYVPWQEASFPGLLGNVVAGRIANRFDLRGTNCITDAACASSLSALSLAVNELALGQSDIVITGGVDALNDIFMYVCFSKTPALSMTGDCRPFSDAADGTILGEGIGMVALKRLEDAERDGDRIYSVIKAIGTSSDGRAKSVYAPLPEGQARALRRTYERAGYGFDTVELVEAHGTGTKAGDAAEFEGLRQMAAEYGEASKPWCALGSVKSQIGHTKAAAGAAGLFKMVMALHHKVLPPTIKVDRPNPKMGIEGSAFYLNTKTRPWIRDSSHPRRASVSSFGFGGSNFHVTAEEYLPHGAGKVAFRMHTRGAELVALSDVSAEALIEKAKALLTSTDEILYIARASSTTFDAKQPHRLAIVAGTREELISKLQNAIDTISKKPNEAFSTPTGIHYGTAASVGDVAFLFPGQGSQYIGMSADLAMEFDSARRVWDEAASLKFTADGVISALHEIVFPRPVFTPEDEAAQTERLTRTEWAQPAIGVASASLLAILRELGVTPKSVAGHSFGELTALYSADALALSDLVSIARRRGELMASSSSEAGAMAAIAAPISDVKRILAELGNEAVVANHNGPTQVVVSGTVASIEKVEAHCAKANITARRLNVSTAFHSPLVAEAQKPFAAFLAKRAVEAPRLDVYSNIDAAPHAKDPARIRKALAAQLAKPVLFVDEIEAMYAHGARVFVEVGPSSVLTDMVGRILGDRPHVAVALDRKGKNGVASLFEGLAKLAAAGVSMSLAPLFEAYEPKREPKKKKPGMSIPISGTNYGRPYPPVGGAAALPPPNLIAKNQSATTPASPAVAAPSVPSANSSANPQQSNSTATNPPQNTAQNRVHAQAPQAPARPAFQSSSAISPKPLTTVPMTQYRPDMNASWVHAFQEAQRNTAEVHLAYQRAMTESHSAFLYTAQAALSGLTQMLTGQAIPMAAQFAPSSAPMLSAPITLSQAPQYVPAPQQAYAAPVAAPVYAPPPAPVAAPVVHAAPAPVAAPAPTPVVAAPAPAAKPVAAPAPAAAAPAPASNGASVDLNDVMLKIVAEKTGYPVDMLGLQMELEADLGIDSIKRVEILSTMRQRVPNLPEVKATELGALRTLGEIVEYMEAAKAGASKKADGASMKGSGEKAALVGAPAKLLRLAVKEVPLQRSGFTWPGIRVPGRVVITNDHTGVASALQKRLAAAHVSAEVVDEVPSDSRVVILLHGLRKIATPTDAIDMQRDAFLAVKSVAAAFEANPGAVMNVQDSGGDFGLSGVGGIRAWGAGLAALIRTFALEAPGSFVRSVDCERGTLSADQIAERIASELFEGGTVQEVGVRANGNRNALVATETTLHEDVKATLTSDDLVVVSGGARGVTAACVIELAKATRAKFILLGRTALTPEPACTKSAANEGAIKAALIADAKARGEKLVPAAIGKQAQEILATREVEHTLESIAKHGSKACYRSVDVRDANAIRATLAELKPTFGNVTGLLHAAGVLADRMLKEKTVDQFDRVFDTKVRGLEALLAATSNDKLKMICFFSSIAARTGNAGQSDYAMANEVLNAVACAERAKRGEACHVRSIGWGPWEGGMVTPTLRDHFTERGVPLIGLDSGAKHFVDDLRDNSAETIVVVARGVGGGALGASAPKMSVAMIDVTPDSHPFLNDHKVAGAVVVPVALVVEWCLRFGRDACPELTCLALEDLRVMRGIRLGANASMRIEVRGAIESNGDTAKVAIELRDAKNALYYTARLVMGPLHKGTQKVSMPAALEKFSEPRIYDGNLLFHGPAFQTISRIDGISKNGADAQMLGMKALGWQKGEWQSDPAIMDGALQLALLWAKNATSGFTLPMGVGAVRIHDASRAAVRGVVRARETTHDRTVCDVFLVADDSTILTEWSGVETIRRPDSPPS